MKAAIDETGVLTVTAETPIEAFALRTWFADYMAQQGESTGTGFAVFQVQLTDRIDQHG